MKGMSISGNVLGRERELDALRVIVDGLVHGQGASMVLSGPPGIGKTALLQEHVAQAHGVGDGPGRPVVSQVTAVEAERGWPYAGLHLILSGLYGSLSPESRRTFEPQASSFLSDLDSAASSYDAAMRLLALVRSVDVPVLVVVDDAHTLDASSQEALGFVARRLRSVPIALVLAADLQDGRSVPLLDGLPALRLGGLATGDAIDMMLSAHDDMAENVAVVLHERTGGNPRALLDVAGRLRPEQRTGQVVLDRFLPPSPVVRGLVLPE
ncbi:AAA family ATPase, partial [Phytoactinopolyspora endophytica]|uniref:AAA family ATPase n=1 Tax=Phytoactinopolyspora endophytica TaxID=1642495 RepID=UPI0013ED9781